MPNDQNRWSLVARAAEAISPKDFQEYFELRRLLVDSSPTARAEFQRRFAIYYRLHNAGLTDTFKKEYFKLLFSFDPRHSEDPYTPLLLTLYKIPRRKGDNSLQASFVTKLVAIHDESRPLFDIHVSKFLGIAAPSLGPIEFRVAGFVENLHLIKARYEEWAEQAEFRAITQRLICKHPQLGICHSTRLTDFLVWSVGAYELT